MFGEWQKQPYTFNIKGSILVMRVKSPKHWITKLMQWTTQWTPTENNAHKSLFCFVFLVLPPWNTFTPSTPKHKNFLDSSSMLNLPPFIIKFIFISMRLWELMSTIWSTHIKIDILVQPSTTYVWTHIKEPLSMVLPTYVCHKNRPKCIAQTMVFWTC